MRVSWHNAGHRPEGCGSSNHTAPWQQRVEHVATWRWHFRQDSSHVWQPEYAKQHKIRTRNVFMNKHETLIDRNPLCRAMRMLHFNNKRQSNVTHFKMISCDFLIFQDGGHPPPWICWSLIWATQKEYLAFFITIQYLVSIGCVFSIIWKCQLQFYAFGLKTPIRENWGFWDIWPPK